MLFRCHDKTNTDSYHQNYNPLHPSLLFFTISVVISDHCVVHKQDGFSSVSSSVFFSVCLQIKFVTGLIVESTGTSSKDRDMAWSVGCETTRIFVWLFCIHVTAAPRAVPVQISVTATIVFIIVKRITNTEQMPGPNKHAFSVNFQN